MKVIEVECYSRVSGFYRPVKQFNKGKKEEFNERRYLKYEQLKQTTDARVMEESV
jgi:hypothetical protein